MPVMDFWKMNGAGNDFIILDNRSGQIPRERFPELARVLCRRRLSIGADGLMVVERPQGDADYRMTFYNADGSLGEMCGNGARCVCRFGYEQGLAGEVQRVETTAGLVTGARIDRRTYRVRLNTPSVVGLDRKVLFRWMGPAGPALMWSWAIPECPMRWFRWRVCGPVLRRSCGSWGESCAVTPPFPRGRT